MSLSARRRTARMGTGIGGGHRNAARKKHAEAKNILSQELEGVGGASENKLIWIHDQLVSALVVSSIEIPTIRLLVLMNAAIRLIVPCQVLDFAKHQTLIKATLYHMNNDRTSEVKCAGYRLLRYLVIKSPNHFQVCSELRQHRIDFLIIRSLEYETDRTINDERLGAAQMLRVLLRRDPEGFSPSLVALLVAIADSKDFYKQFAIEVLCELALLNPHIIARNGGFSVLVRSVLESECRVQTEVMVLTFMTLSDSHLDRLHFKAHQQLPRLLAPLTNTAYCHAGVAEDDGLGTMSVASINLPFITSSYMSAMTMMNTWPGFFFMCSSQAGIQSLVTTLNLPVGVHNQFRINALLGLIFSMLRLGIPRWASNLDDALKRGPTSPSVHSRHTPRPSDHADLLEIYLSLTLLAFIEAGLHTVLIQLLTTCSNNFISTRATILLWNVLDLAARFGVSSAKTQDTLTVQVVSHCVDLMNDSSTHHFGEQTRARRLLMDLDACDAIRKTFDNEDDSVQLMFANGLDDALFVATLKETRVSETKDPTGWNWQHIVAIVSHPGNLSRKRLESTTVAKWLKRVLNAFKPNGKYLVEPSQAANETSRFVARALMLLDDIGMKFLTAADLIPSLSQALQNPDPTSLCFGKRAVDSKLAEMFFIWIGEFSSSVKGNAMLAESHVFKQLYKICDNMSEDKHRVAMMKIVGTHIDPKFPGHPRILFQMLLTSDVLQIRVFSTQRAAELLAKNNTSRREHYLIELLSSQLCDADPEVSSIALTALSKLSVNTEAMIKLIDCRPPLLHLQQDGYDLLLQFVGIDHGFKYLDRCGFLIPELDKWQRSKLTAYASRVEEMFSRVFEVSKPATARDSDFTCSITSPRSGTDLSQLHQLRIPPHLYGQLCRVKAGFELLQKTGHVLTLERKILSSGNEGSHHHLASIKAAIWGIAHVASTNMGLSLISDVTFKAIVAVAEDSKHFSLRGTAMMALSLLAKTALGASRLHRLGWIAKRGARGVVLTVLPSSPSSFFARAVTTSPNKSRHNSRDPSIVPVRKAPFGSSLYEFIGSVVNIAIERGMGQSYTMSDVFRRAIVLCISSMSNDISAGKVFTLLKKLRHARQDLIDTIETYIEVRESIDMQGTSLAKRRVINTIFSNWRFLGAQVRSLSRIHDAGSPASSRPVTPIDNRSPRLRSIYALDEETCKSQPNSPLSPKRAMRAALINSNVETNRERIDTVWNRVPLSRAKDGLGSPSITVDDVEDTLFDSGFLLDADGNTDHERTDSPNATPTSPGYLISQHLTSSSSLSTESPPANDKSWSSSFGATNPFFNLRFSSDPLRDPPTPPTPTTPTLTAPSLTTTTLIPTTRTTTATPSSATRRGDVIESKTPVTTASISESATKSVVGFVEQNPTLYSGDASLLGSPKYSAVAQRRTRVTATDTHITAPNSRLMQRPRSVAILTSPPPSPQPSPTLGRAQSVVINVDPRSSPSQSPAPSPAPSPRPQRPSRPSLPTVLPSFRASLNPNVDHDPRFSLPNSASTSPTGRRKTLSDSPATLSPVAAAVMHHANNIHANNIMHTTTNPVSPFLHRKTISPVPPPIETTQRYLVDPLKLFPNYEKELEEDLEEARSLTQLDTQSI